MPRRKICEKCGSDSMFPRVKYREPERAFLHQKCRQPKTLRKKGRL